MRSVLALLAAVFLLCSCSSGNSISPENESSEQAVSTTEIADPNQEILGEIKDIRPVGIEISELGIPLANKYHYSDEARTPNDIILHNGLLHVGSGEYTRNSGPVEMYFYDTAEKKWKKNCELPEEAIIRFCEIETELFAPGIDARESWEFGSYYVFENGNWVQNRSIPNGVHVFDITKFNNRLFFAIGTDDSANAVVYEDEKGDFISPDFIDANGEILKGDESNVNSQRVYDIFVLDGQLFSLRNGKDIYRFDGEVFKYFSVWENFLTVHIGYDGGTVRKTVFNGKLFIVGGWFYYTKDGKTLDRISLPKKDYAADLDKNGEFLYLLTDQKLENGDFLITVLASKSGNEGEFYEFCSFTYPIPAVSFSVGENAIYFGMMDNTEASPLNGMIIEAKIK